MFPSGSFAVTLQCSHQCDHSVPGLENLKRTKVMYQRCSKSVHLQCPGSVPAVYRFWENLGKFWEHWQAHFKCSKFFRFPGMCLLCPQNFPKFSQKQYTAETLPGNCKCPDAEHLWYIAL